MIPGSHHGRFRAVMWGAIGVTFMILAVVAIYQLDTRTASYAIGTLLLACLAVCVAPFWLDARATRTADQPHRLSKHRTSESSDPAAVPRRIGTFDPIDLPPDWKA